MTEQIFQAVTCQTFIIQNVKDIAVKIDAALQTCWKEKKPVYLELPCNFVNKQVGLF